MNKVDESSSPSLSFIKAEDPEANNVEVKNPTSNSSTASLRKAAECLGNPLNICLYPGMVSMLVGGWMVALSALSPGTLGTLERRAMLVVGTGFAGYGTFEVARNLGTRAYQWLRPATPSA